MFYSFPQQGNDLRKRWKEALCDVDYIEDEKSLICSQHFDASDLIPLNLNGEVQCVLRQDAVPKVIVPETMDYEHIDGTIQDVDTNNIKTEPIDTALNVQEYVIIVHLKPFINGTFCQIKI